MATLAEGRLEEGIHRYQWDATGLAGGVYLMRLQVDGKVETRKMSLVK